MTLHSIIRLRRQQKTIQNNHATKQH